ncbi:ABC transporter ATP-binding protein [Gorillibacterium timonense]|uniref:ABC transporter ATP-binding protein n=1 Tax=Gorillibacterium timonense TaxID=1689269 RepID=UPI00071C37AD|nr:ABC transporter ATP-binding protein [Gorillibacterium timonense]
MNAIELHGLTKKYGNSRGIDGLTFAVEEGETFGFIGPNGAGKSTTIRTLLALIYPTAGSATLFGKDCIRCSAEIKKDIGYLPSEVFYYDNMRVKDLLAYSASFYKKDCTKRMKELSERMELDLSRRIDDLSFGNKKKVGIVQGLLHEPKLVILDEPTSGLDPLMQQRFFELLEEEGRKGTTIFFSSHILSEVQRLCNRVAIIKEGKLVQLEKISELTANANKRIRLATAAPVAPDFFAMPGVSREERQGGEIRFLFRGDLGMLTAKLASMSLTNLWIEEPDLEEIFLHYYEKEAPEAARL